MRKGPPTDIPRTPWCMATYANRPFMWSFLARPRMGTYTPLGHHRCGAALVASLLLLAVLTMLGLAAVSTTLFEFLISDNHRNATAMLHLAEAGSEHAREALRVLNATSADAVSFTDELLQVAGQNGMLDGFAGSSDDLPLIPLTPSPLGRAMGSYIVYLTNDAADQSNPLLDSNGRVTLVAVARQPNGAQRIVKNGVMRYAGPLLQATLYGKEKVSLDGTAELTIDGHDRCLQASSLAPIYTLSPALTEQLAPATLLGSPAEPQQGLQAVDILSHLTTMKTGSTELIVLTTDQTGTAFGNASHYVTVYAKPADPSNTQGLQLINGVGYGLLLVEGNLTVRADFEWHGLLLVNGDLTIEGSIGTPNIRGAILTQGATLVHGSVDIQYDSCAVNQALNNQALVVISWKETY